MTPRTPSVRWGRGAAAVAITASLWLDPALPQASFAACTRPYKERGITLLSADELRRQLVGNSITWEDEGLDYVEHYRAGTSEGEIVGLEGGQPYRGKGRWRILDDCFCLEFADDFEAGGCYTIGRKRDREAKRGALAALIFYQADGRKEGPADLWAGDLTRR